MAQDKDKRPKERFNLAAEGTEIEVVFESDMDIGLEEDEEPLRSNTDPKHDPKNVKNRGLTPSGSGPMFGAPRKVSQAPNNQHPLPQRGIPATRERQEELLNGNHDCEDILNGLRVRTWLSEEPSAQGFRGGHIRELVVTQGEYESEAELAHFKNGKWEREAEMTPERDAFAQAVNKYDYDFIKAQLEKEQEARENQRELERNKDTGKSR